MDSQRCVNEKYLLSPHSAHVWIKGVILRQFGINIDLQKQLTCFFLESVCHVAVVIGTLHNR